MLAIILLVTKFWMIYVSQTHKFLAIDTNNHTVLTVEFWRTDNEEIVREALNDYPDLPELESKDCY